MVGTLHGHHPDAGFPRLGGSQLHRGDHGRVAQVMAPIDDGGRRTFPLDDHLRAGVQLPCVDEPLIHGQHGNAVRINAQQIGVHHDFRGDFRPLRSHAPRGQNRKDLFPDGVCCVLLHELPLVSPRSYRNKTRRATAHAGAAYLRRRYSVGLTPYLRLKAVLSANGLP